MMTKLMTVAGVALLSLCFAALGYAAQGQTDTGGTSGQVSPSTPDATNPSMGGDRGSQRDTDSSATKQPKKKGKSSSESSLGVDKNQNAEKGSQGSGPKAGKAPAPPAEGSNPSLDKTGKGSASGG
jgi:hypothetical protein